MESEDFKTRLAFWTAQEMKKTSLQKHPVRDSHDSNPEVLGAAVYGGEIEGQTSNTMVKCTTEAIELPRVTTEARTNDGTLPATSLETMTPNSSHTIGDSGGTSKEANTEAIDISSFSSSSRCSKIFSIKLKPVTSIVLNIEFDFDNKKLNIGVVENKELSSNSAMVEVKLIGVTKNNVQNSDTDVNDKVLNATDNERKTEDNLENTLENSGITKDIKQNSTLHCLEKSEDDNTTSYPTNSEIFGIKLNAVDKKKLAPSSTTAECVKVEDKSSQKTSIETVKMSNVNCSTTQMSLINSVLLEASCSSKNQLTNRENNEVQQISDEIKTFEDISEFWKKETQKPLPPPKKKIKQVSNSYDVEKLKREVFSKFTSNNLAKYFGLEEDVKENSSERVTNHQSPNRQSSITQLDTHENMPVSQYEEVAMQQIITNKDNKLKQASQKPEKEKPLDNVPQFQNNCLEPKAGPSRLVKNPQMDDENNSVQQNSEDNETLMDIREDRMNGTKRPSLPLQKIDKQASDIWEENNLMNMSAESDYVGDEASSNSLRTTSNRDEDFAEDCMEVSMEENDEEFFERNESMAMWMNGLNNASNASDYVDVEAASSSPRVNKNDEENFARNHTESSIEDNNHKCIVKNEAETDGKENSRAKVVKTLQVPLVMTTSENILTCQSEQVTSQGKENMLTVPEQVSPVQELEEREEEKSSENTTETEDVSFKEKRDIFERNMRKDSNVEKTNSRK